MYIILNLKKLTLNPVIEDDFIDTDSVIAESENQSISEIFVDKGEPYFREKELEVLLHQISNHSNQLRSIKFYYNLFRIM